ncbi:uncharacterized protein N7484_003860 [Penicillium longicatenatum]|uniref:uncharacterized protein n=1 Tax=Penicillium longicatenatum TaxID=1561947 RepID=UPI00254766B8|nr:uncharacterized protein N7484_003860 [Penicillium longicatenatum]KAJ5650137.1 hypothetical protein N7484_003860 [Penicillium longicatenatum]
MPNLPENRPVEQLFLEYSIQDVHSRNKRFQIVEPWGSLCVNAIREERFGDAIWARYHISGGVVNGIVGGSDNMTVLEVIKEDALGYRVGDPEEYAKALLLYAKSSPADGHADVLELIANLPESDIARVQAEYDIEREEQRQAEREAEEADSEPEWERACL